MKISTLRVLDLWIGRPICWLITGLYFFKRLFIKKSPPENPGKILFIKLFGIGSVVLTYPAIIATQRRFPEAEICFLTFQGNQSILPMIGALKAENIYTVRDDTLPHLIHDVFRCLAILVRMNFDVVIDLEFFSRFTAILSFALRARYRIGFYGFYTEGLRRGRFINFPVNYNHTLHTSRAFFTLLKPLGIGQDSFTPNLPTVPATNGFSEKIGQLLRVAGRENLDRNIKNWVVMNPNSSELIALRKWPAGHFVELVALLLGKYDDLGIVFIGNSGDRPCVENIMEGIAEKNHPGRVVNLAGATSIADLLDLFHFAEILITNDSGPAHLAALTGIPTIAIFGPETPALYAPLNENCECVTVGLDCQPCISIFNGKHSYCHDNQCLKQLSAERIFHLATAMLNKSKPPAKRAPVSSAD